MDFYLEREGSRLEAAFEAQLKEEAANNAVDLPALSVPLIADMLPDAPSPSFPGSPIQPTGLILSESPWQDELPPLYVRAIEDPQQLSMDSPPPIIPIRRGKKVNTPLEDSPPSNVSPLQAVLRSSIPNVQLKVVPQQPNLNPKISKRVEASKKPPAKPSPYKIINKFEKMDWEEINTYLHGKYPNSSPGVLCLKILKGIPAIIDYDELVEIDRKNDPDLFLIKTWIKKLHQAILDCADSD